MSGEYEKTNDPGSLRAGEPHPLPAEKTEAPGPETVRGPGEWPEAPGILQGESIGGDALGSGTIHVRGIRRAARRRLKREGGARPSAPQGRPRRSGRSCSHG